MKKINKKFKCSHCGLVLDDENLDLLCIIECVDPICYDCAYKYYNELDMLCCGEVYISDDIYIDPQMAWLLNL